MKETENYFSIIPSRILEDNTLTPLARLMYGKLASLTNRDGYCWASNKYIGECFASKISITSRNVKALERAGYIRIELIDNSKRKIFLVDNLCKTLVQKYQPPSTKVPAPCYKSTRNYNKGNNINKYNGECSKEHNSESARAELEALKRKAPIKSL